MLEKAETYLARCPDREEAILWYKHDPDTYVLGYDNLTIAFALPEDPFTCQVLNS